MGNNAVIGGFANIGSNVSIGGNLRVTGLITSGILNNSTVATSTIASQAVSTGQGTSSSTVLTSGGVIANTNYPYTFVALTLTTAVPLAQVYTSGVIYLRLLGSLSPSSVYIILYRTGDDPETLFTLQASKVTNAFGPIYAVPFNFFDVVVNVGTNTWNIGAYWDGTGSNGQFSFLAGTLVLQQLKPSLKF